MRKLVKPTLSLAIASLFVSYSLWQTSATTTPHPTVSILVEKAGRISMIRKIELKHRFTHRNFSTKIDF